ncbi:TlyA family RNA methyltransferase [Fictibacillus terranigra]|uniref:TlyA family RNA methyltransferase n=1 Tax=Fictibacillus terranigra TaxID=3058424 RepID=A0ABT8E9Z4_9BACL|nr:TlyA family RNA methyltransferase [Fictibacillus sp. CENA-BCM004]MDN4074692.1 TlyA family RNA methyltransferase [Fictibacillus sp. CENA-BCM004]
MKKERIDVLLVERGLSETREKAKRSIMAGLVYSGSERLDKPGLKIDIEAPLAVKGNEMPYVSRGGLKLEKAIKAFDLELEGKIVLDIGASTGGFTDCALQNGAKFVYALDVGYNQLAWKIRQDERVAVMERTNFRYVKREDLQFGLPEFATIDVSFISLKLILPVLKTILKPGGEVMALIKPQFEAGRADVGKKGIVRDPVIHERVIGEIIRFSLHEGYNVLNLSYSPITGGEGNIEFLVHLKTEAETAERPFQEEKIAEVVTEAHQLFKKTDADE